MLLSVHPPPPPPPPPPPLSPEYRGEGSKSWNGSRGILNGTRRQRPGRSRPAAAGVHRLPGGVRPGLHVLATATAAANARRASRVSRCVAGGAVGRHIPGKRSV